MFLKKNILIILFAFLMVSFKAEAMLKLSEEELKEGIQSTKFKTEDVQPPEDTLIWDIPTPFIASHVYTDDATLSWVSESLLMRGNDIIRDTTSNDTIRDTTSVDKPPRTDNIDDILMVVDGFAIYPNGTIHKSLY